MKVKGIKVLLFICIMLFPITGFAKDFVCANSNGNLYLSKTPCPIPETDLSIKPISSNKLNKIVLENTVRLFRTATKSKDVLSIERLLSDDFIFFKQR